MVDPVSCPGAAMARIQSERVVYSLYCEDRDLGDRLERVLAGVPVRRVPSREALLAPSLNTCATVVGIAACSDGDFEWLRSAFGPLSPPCVVVAHLSVNCLRQLYPLRSDQLRIVWVDEADGRLVEVLEEFRRISRGPIWRLGLRLLSDYSFRPSISETISRICGLQTDAVGTPVIPDHSVGRLADHVGLASSTLSRYWRLEVPLRCSLKEFVSWAVLLWSARARSRDNWGAVADQVGLRRRTLERNFLRMAGCTLVAVADDPEQIARRFNEWVDAVWEPHSVNGSRGYDPAPADAPGAKAT